MGPSAEEALLPCILQPLTRNRPCCKGPYLLQYLPGVKHTPKTGRGACQVYQARQDAQVVSLSCGGRLLVTKRQVSAGFQVMQGGKHLPH